MPFDAALTPDQFAAPGIAPIEIGALVRCAPDPDPALAGAAPDRLLAFLFLSPRPCAAFDRLIAG